MGKRAQHMTRGWEISDVERLTGLPRRYIQRACYAGKDGVGLLTPQTHARERTYGIHDLAMLYIVRLLRDERYSRDHQRHTLGEVRDTIARQGGDARRILRAESELLRDQLEEVLDQYLHARAFEASLDESAPRERLIDLLAEVEAVGTALGTDAGVSIRELPGVDLAQELYQALGAGVDAGDQPQTSEAEPARENA